MGCLQRWSENEGKETVENFLRSAKMNTKRNVTVDHDGLSYEFSLPCSMSEVDLVIRETFEAAHDCPPDDSEVDNIFSLLGEAAKK